MGGGRGGGGEIGNVSYFVFPKILVGIQDHIWLCAQQVKASECKRTDVFSSGGPRNPQVKLVS